MRGMNLNVFDFDYDLTWVGFFLNADETVYGRFGGREADSAEKYLTLPALRYALQRALETHRSRPVHSTPSLVTVQYAEELPAARRLAPRACIHCHQVYDFRNEASQAAGTWRLDDAWVYPEPRNLGLILSTAQGDGVLAVTAGLAAERAGLRAGDTLRSVNGHSVASFADVQYALHQAPAEGRIAVTWEREGRTVGGQLELHRGWRQTDRSWRASTRRLGPAPVVQGEDLTPEEKQALGLASDQLAFRLGAFLTATARQAGLRGTDVILGLEGESFTMSERQFVTHLRLHFKPGDRVTLQVLRDGQRLRVPLTLPPRKPF